MNAIATHMLPDDLQRSNEHYYSRKHIRARIQKALDEDSQVQAQMTQGVELLQDWLDHSFYPSKNARLAQVKTLDLKQLVNDVFLHIAHVVVPETFVSVTSQLAHQLGFNDHREAILTVAEITAVLCHTDAFDIIKETPQSQLMLVSKMLLPQPLIDSCERSMFMPPMVCPPPTITSNYESPYLTHNECQILGRRNAHEKDICLDIINLQNSVAMTLNVDFLSDVEEVPTFELDTQEKARNWRQYQRETKEIRNLLLKQGNHFWLTHAVDKRGRLYPRGYHVNYQSTAYSKACLELSNKELVEGVPNEYRQ